MPLGRDRKPGEAAGVNRNCACSKSAAVDEFTRLRFLAAYPEQSTFPKEETGGGKGSKRQALKISACLSRF
ncbi:MAG: hypothetical protein ACLTNE_13170 [Intestinimonas butyriciproducens]|uniref:hypothetical protein n=2 Tax=Intestinimonas butyriciproducens TaxID=1297617 RepID=UPI001D249C01|nr:hypothetical protein [Intestinimonas butyriciproducens]